MLHELAQANIARLRYRIDGPEMADFVEQLDFVNETAEASEGFVWRLQSPKGNAVDIRIFDDPGLLLNMSVWESVEALRRFTYLGAHASPLRDRHKWFEPPPPDRPTNVLWWVEQGRRPTVAEAEARFRLLWSRGPGPEAFTFRQVFDPPHDEP
ncbi:MAG: DUF3291 domain-containing protein [Thermoanaerobaculia bacterium]|nr:DUF3291 domain-containing protein [Thermoanaerobaculia bacterium]